MGGKRLLAIDVGGGTQDILLYEDGVAIENCVHLILPSPTVLAAAEIRSATAVGQGIFLARNLMGGGAVVSAVKRHLEAGLPVYARPMAAKTIFDDLARVEAWGVRLVETSPPGTLAVSTGDVDLPRLARALKPYGIELPRSVAVAVQDHGESLGVSNRLFRFQHWQDFLKGGARLESLVYWRNHLPSYLTRMGAVLADVPDGLVMDTVAAAFWGVLEDETVSRQAATEGAILLNVGNQHTTAALCRGGSFWGLFEHHTGLMTADQLFIWVQRLREGTLSHQEVFAAGGHGAYIRPDYDASQHGFSFLAVTGPQRGLARGLNGYWAAPYGDMMLTGCFGLVRAWREVLASGAGEIENLNMQDPAQIGMTSAGYGGAGILRG